MLAVLGAFNEAHGVVGEAAHRRGEWSCYRSGRRVALLPPGLPSTIAMTSAFEAQAFRAGSWIRLMIAPRLGATPRNRRMRCEKPEELV